MTNLPASISIVIPVHNEEGNVVPLVEAITATLAGCEISTFEIIMVDDGSTDGTPEQLAKLAEKYDSFKLITLRKNFGKASALTAGFHHASGDIIITMDGDLQDDPADIPLFLQKLDEGFDMVSGWKKTRRDPLEKRFASRIFNFISSKITGINIHDFNCGFKAYRSWCLKDMVVHGITYRFLPALVANRGATVTEIEVHHHKRRQGKSKYGYRRYFEGGLDLVTVLFITRFIRHPLYMFAGVSILPLILGLVLGLYLLALHLGYLFGCGWGEQLVVRPLLDISISLFGFGVLIVLVGLVCELVMRQNAQFEHFQIKDCDPSLRKEEKD